jgi:hypothetical protein
MKTVIRITCAVLAVLLLSGCNSQPAKGVQNTPTAPKGYYVYTGEESMFRGGKLDELMDLCEVLYIDETDRTSMEDAAAAAIIASLGDRWSYYIPADQYTAYQEQKDNA